MPPYVYFRYHPIYNIKNTYTMSDSETEPTEDQSSLIKKLKESFLAAHKSRARAIYINSQLQNKAAEYYRRKKSTESQTAINKNKNNDEENAGEMVNESNQEQRYTKYIEKLKQSKEDLKALNLDIQKQSTEIKNEKDETYTETIGNWNELVDYYKDVCTQAVSARSGKALNSSDIDANIKLLEKKEEEVSSARLEHIKMTNRLKKKEQQLKQREELADGLHLIDFEQLKIENQTYNEKIEERNEELLKLNQKITNTVQVLTHYKEKLQFLESDSQIQGQKLCEIESDVIRCRDVLNKHKQNRDRLRSEYHKLQQNAGLLGSIGGSGIGGNKKSLILLKDFEERQDESLKLEADIDSFRNRHGELILDIKVFEKKMEKVKNAGSANVMNGDVGIPQMN